MNGHRHSVTRRTVLRGAVAAAAAGATPAFAQANWPAQQIRLIVPYPAGGSTDVLARILAEELKQKLGQQLDNAKRKLELLKRDIAELHSENMATLKERRAEIRARLDQQRSHAEQMQSKIADWRSETSGRAVDAITSWEQRREIEKLQAHAKRAEDIALDMVNVATHDFEEAEQAVLEALAARLEADQALAPA